VHALLRSQAEQTNRGPGVSSMRTQGGTINKQRIVRVAGVIVVSTIWSDGDGGINRCAVSVHGELGARRGRPNADIAAVRVVDIVTIGSPLTLNALWISEQNYKSKQDGNPTGRNRASAQYIAAHHCRFSSLVSPHCESSIGHHCRLSRRPLAQ